MVTANRDDVVKVLKSKRAAYKKYGVKSLALFGSAARNRLRKRSDVDILVQFTKPTWANYIGLKFYLEDLLGREVDLVTPKGLKPAIRPSVEKDLLYVVS
ncbi:nucleotidyltransferase family protein [Chloroflexi bacterium CFX6]|nr:nucleotidyltransferase family protein [Chloroflexi bacterium CFX6]